MTPCPTFKFVHRRDPGHSSCDDRQWRAVPGTRPRHRVGRGPAPARCAMTMSPTQAGATTRTFAAAAPMSFVRRSRWVAPSLRLGTGRARPLRLVVPCTSVPRLRGELASPDIAPVAAMMRALARPFEDFRARARDREPSAGEREGLAPPMGSIAGTTVEVACARTGPKDRCEGAAQARHSRGQRSLRTVKPLSISATIRFPGRFVIATSGW